MLDEMKNSQIIEKVFCVYKADKQYFLNPEKRTK